MEAIRTCKYGNKYKGYYCNCDKCSKARKAHNTASTRSRARNGGTHKIKRYAASSFVWSGAATIGPVNPSACPKQRQDDEPEARGNYTRDEFDYMRHPD